MTKPTPEQINAYVDTLSDDAMEHLRDVIDAKISVSERVPLPEMSRRQKNLAAAIREHLAGHDLNEVFSVFLHILAGELEQISKIDPHIAQRNAYRFGRLLVSRVART